MYDDGNAGMSRRRCQWWRENLFERVLEAMTGLNMTLITLKQMSKKGQKTCFHNFKPCDRFLNVKRLVTDRLCMKRLKIH